MPPPAAEHNVSKIKRRFKKLDRNGDGNLSMAEMARLLRKGRSDITDRDLQILFSSVDKNGNGRVEFGEFVDFVFQEGTAPAGSSQERRFRRQNWDAIAERDDVSWEQLKGSYAAYAGKNSVLEGSEFARMCRDCGVFDASFGGQELDTIFAYVCSRGERNLTPKQFQEALERIAAQKNCPAVAIRAMIAAGPGPVLTSTKARGPKLSAARA